MCKTDPAISDWIHALGWPKPNNTVSFGLTDFLRDARVKTSHVHPSWETLGEVCRAQVTNFWTQSCHILFNYSHLALIWVLVKGWLHGNLAPVWPDEELTQYQHACNILIVLGNWRTGPILGPSRLLPGPSHCPAWWITRPLAVPYCDMNQSICRTYVSIFKP